MSNEQPKEREMFSAPGQVIVIEPMDPILASVIEVFEKEQSNEVHRVASEAEAHQVMMQAGICLMVISVQNKEQALSATKLLKKCEAQVLSKQARVVVISSFNDSRMVESFSKSGVSESIFNKIDATMLMQKMKAHLKGQKVRKETQIQMKEQQAEKASLMKAAEAAPAKVAPEAQPAPAPKHVQLSDKPEIGPPLEKAPDVFLIGSTRPRRVGVQWVLEVEGPDSITGAWSEVQIQGSDQKSKSAWVWKEPGFSECWHFVGNQPQYNPSTRKWRFVGSRPELHWMEGGSVIESKISILPEGRFLLAMDSPETKTNLESNRSRGKVIREANKKKLEEESKAAAAKSISDPTSEPAGVDPGVAENPNSTPFRNKLRKRVQPDQTQACFAVDFLSKISDAHLAMTDRDQFRAWLASELQVWLGAESVGWAAGAEPEIQRKTPLSAVEQAVLSRLKNVA